MADYQRAYTGYGMPSVDFSTLGSLGDVYNKNKSEATLAQLGPLLQSGKIDFQQAAGIAASAGQPNVALSFLNQQEQRQQHGQANSRAEQDFQFRQQEAQRAQGNADRSYGLQERQFTAGLEGQKLPSGFARGENGALAPVPGGPADPNYIKQSSEAKLGGGLLDQPTLEQMAEQYRFGDTSVLTNLGRGAQGSENVKALRQEIVRQNTAAGVSGGDQAIRNAEYFGTKAGQRTIGVKGANIELAATEFKQVLPVVQEASAAVSRTNYPDLNKIIQAYETKTGDPAIVKFGGGINTLVNLYARAISPNGVGTVSDKDHAREILQKAWSQGQFDAAVGMMTQEIDAALASPEKVRDDMRRRFLGGQGATQAAPSEPARATSPKPGEVRDGYRFKGGDPASPQSWIKL